MKYFLLFLTNIFYFSKSLIINSKYNKNLLVRYNTNNDDNYWKSRILPASKTQGVTKKPGF